MGELQEAEDQILMPLIMVKLVKVDMDYRNMEMEVSHGGCDKVYIMLDKILTKIEHLLTKGKNNNNNRLHKEVNRHKEVTWITTGNHIGRIIHMLMHTKGHKSKDTKEVMLKGKE